MRALTERESWLAQVAEQRCASDLAQPAEAMPRWLGSGARIVQRRVTALRGLAAGDTVDVVSSASGLSGDRVAALGTEFDAHGLACISPAFTHGSASDLTREQKRAISDLVNELDSDRGTFVWLPLVRDLAVERGIATDLSDRQVAAVPLRRSSKDGATGGSRLESELPGRADGRRTTLAERRKLFVATGVLVVAAVGLAVVAATSGETGAVWGSIFCGIFGILCVLGIIEDRRTRRLAELATSSGPDDGMPSTGVRTGRWPTVEIVDVSAPSGGPLVRTAEGVPILFLWLFDRRDGVHDMVAHGWASLGPVTLLINPRALPTLDKRRAIRKPHEYIIDDAASFDRHLQRREPPVRAVRALPDFLGMGRFQYDGYPITPLLCSERFWKSAFTELAAASEIAVLDLSGFDEERLGLRFEVEQTVDSSAAAAPALLLGVGDPLERTIDAVAAVTQADHLTFFRTPLGDPVSYLRGNMPLAGRSRLGRTFIDRLTAMAPPTGEIDGVDGSVAERIWSHVSDARRST